MRKFKPYINKKIYIDETVFKDPASEIKIGYLNINGVDCESHSHYLNHDHNLKNLNICIKILCFSRLRTLDLAFLHEFSILIFAYVCKQKFVTKSSH